ncbi:hypothetical protein JW859_06850 [bacterium]|nr:hypothetical protein [bacterium]
MFMHEMSVLESQGVVNPFIERPNWETYYIDVDENGFAVPVLESVRREFERMHNGGDAVKDEAACTHSFQSIGLMDPDMQRTMQDGITAIKAEFLPQIPDWLAEAPPAWAMVLPDGRIVTQGPVGQLGMFVPPEDTFQSFLYAPDGSLLKRTEDAIYWQELFFDAGAVFDKYNHDTTYIYEDNGYLVVIDRENNRRAAVYDFDGKRLSKDHNTRDRDATRFYKISAGELNSIHHWRNFLSGSAI